MIQYNTATISSNATQSRLHSYRSRPRRSGTMLAGRDSEFTVRTVYIFGFRRARGQNIDSGSSGGKKKKKKPTDIHTQNASTMDDWSLFPQIKKRIFQVESGRIMWRLSLWGYCRPVLACWPRRLDILKPPLV